MTTITTTSTTTTAVTPEVRLSTPEDVPAISETVARAFFSDPTMVWIVPDEDRRRAISPAVFRLYAEVLQPLGQTWVTADGAGVALWIPPGLVVPAEADTEEFEARAAELMGPDVERLGELIAVMDANLPTEPHAHLNLFGVLPERQGQGIGGALLEAALPGLDRDGVPAYLEATTDRNRRLYERHGFVYLGDIAPTGGPTLRRMWREPRDLA